jgi:hypothetical protein
LEDLRDEVSIELTLLEATVREAVDLRRDVRERNATVREKTAAAAFLAQFYSGVENILKRLCRFHGVNLPSGETWHVELFQRFCATTPIHFRFFLLTSWRPGSPGTGSSATWCTMVTDFSSTGRG